MYLDKFFSFYKSINWWDWWEWEWIW